VSFAARTGHETRVVETASDVARAAREELVRAGKSAIEARGRFTLVLSGGSTPKSLYAALTAKDLDWGKVHVYFGDERCVSPERQESNFKMAQEALLLRVKIPPENVHRIQGEMESAEAAAAQYEEELKAAFGGSDGPPHFDLVLLGLGTDGHTASLFPGSSALDESERWVAANWVAKLSRNRITMTFPVLNRAALVIFLVAGDEKAEAVRRAIEGAPAGMEVPAHRVDPPGGRVVWLLDRMAATKLTAKN
jgi:6-phosphogluconolactonase